MIRVGITGQAGFVGTHLYNTLGLHPTEFERIPFEDDFFSDDTKLTNFIKSCDAVVHLAAMNRHNDPEVIFETNVRLVKQLLNACEATNSAPHILFSSSTQEERDNLYGRSKKMGRELFEQWANKQGAGFTGFVIPNVFGPFGNPYYNSVVATFCHQLTHGEMPKIDIDGEVKLIYVGELVNEIITQIYIQEPIISKILVPHTATIKVSDLLKKLTSFKENYLEKAILPKLDNPFERNLFNTFVCYIDHESFFPFRLKLNTDSRGSFVETMRLSSGGQISFSTTIPGITRGNHFHTRKAERFAVIKGKALIELRRIGTDKVHSFELNGDYPSFVDMPVWYTHNITNIGEEDLYTIFWINEHFDATDPDTYFENVRSVNSNL
jgi:UDP-2-acetamido-2,6-beta-L-arabino-hexul-4-ose reductase